MTTAGMAEKELAESEAVEGDWGGDVGRPSSLSPPLFSPLSFRSLFAHSSTREHHKQKLTCKTKRVKPTPRDTLALERKSLKLELRSELMLISVNMR